MKINKNYELVYVVADVPRERAEYTIDGVVIKFTACSEDSAYNKLGRIIGKFCKQTGLWPIEARELREIKLGD